MSKLLWIFEYYLYEIQFLKYFVCWNFFMSTNSEIGKSASLYCWSRENFLKAFEYSLGCSTIVVGFGGVWRPHSPLCSSKPRADGRVSHRRSSPIQHSNSVQQRHATTNLCKHAPTLLPKRGCCSNYQRKANSVPSKRSFRPVRKYYYYIHIL